MDILRFILLFFTLTLCLNAVLKNWFDKLTIYNGIEFHWMPTWFILTFMFFGFLMFPFYKMFREYRKVYYMENAVRQYEWRKLAFGYDDDYNKKYLSFKRYLKLKKLKRKI
jgi:hypothetical protein